MLLPGPLLVLLGIPDRRSGLRQPCLDGVDMGVSLALRLRLDVLRFRGRLLKCFLSKCLRLSFRLTLHVGAHTRHLLPCLVELFAGGKAVLAAERAHMLGLRLDDGLGTLRAPEGVDGLVRGLAPDLSAADAVAGVDTLMEVVLERGVVGFPAFAGDPVSASRNALVGGLAHPPVQPSLPSWTGTARTWRWGADSSRWRPTATMTDSGPSMSRAHSTTSSAHCASQAGD